MSCKAWWHIFEGQQILTRRVWLEKQLKRCKFLLNQANMDMESPVKFLWNVLEDKLKNVFITPRKNCCGTFEEKVDHIHRETNSST